jgi:N-acetyl-anhydromuramyl-L-alanine amidase AmpD
MARRRVPDPSYTNIHAIGIEAQASGVDPWPAAQMDAYARLCRALADNYGLPVSRALGHKETCAPVGRKVDPNFDMAAFRRQITALEDDWT